MGGRIECTVSRFHHQTVGTGTEHGTEFQNVTVIIQLPRAGYYNDAAIRLVTPTNEAANAKTVLARFLSSFRFFDHD